MSDLEKEINRIVDERVEKALEEKLPAIIRALGIREADEESDGLVDAVEVAKFLGRDLSSPENILKARKHVYHLARINSIPSVRISERNLRFDLAKVKEALAAKQSQAA
jgi:hypothetical protein